MALLSLEHSPTVYRLDFALYGCLSLTMATALWGFGPSGSSRALWLWAAAGGAGWTLVEYLLHRFVLHGLAPFSRWHADHHRRPTALIGSPTVMSLGLFLVFAIAPAWWLLGAWPACAVSFGLLTGYLSYGLVHHAVHHRVVFFGFKSPWLRQRRYAHARHHAAHHDKFIPMGHYGVVTGFWDLVFGT